jgi:hypothetical protein
MFAPGNFTGERATEETFVLGATTVRCAGVRTKIKIQITSASAKTARLSGKMRFTALPPIANSAGIPPAGFWSLQLQRSGCPRDTNAQMDCF